MGYTIYYVSDHGIWTLVGATAQHGNSTAFNHWMTTNAANGLYYTTLDYQANVNPALVSVNDMALPFGGKFDINGTGEIATRVRDLIRDICGQHEVSIITAVRLNFFGFE